VAQSLGVQLQQQRLSRGLDEEQVLLVVEAVAEREHQLERARQELHDAKAAVQRYTPAVLFALNVVMTIRCLLTNLRACIASFATDCSPRSAIMLKLPATPRMR
jgi:hypothetical protein